MRVDIILIALASVIIAGCGDSNRLVIKKGDGEQISLYGGVQRDTEITRATIVHGFDIDETRTLLQFNCKTKEYIELQTEFIEYSSRDAPRVEREGQWKAVSPTTIINTAFEYTCFGIKP